MLKYFILFQILIFQVQASGIYSSADMERYNCKAGKFSITDFTVDQIIMDAHKKGWHTEGFIITKNTNQIEAHLKNDGLKVFASKFSLTDHFKIKLTTKDISNRAQNVKTTIAFRLNRKDIFTMYVRYDGGMWGSQRTAMFTGKCQKLD